MKRTILIILFAITGLTSARAQFGFVGYAEYGYSIFKYKSEELKIFLNSYNNYYNNIARPFGMKLSAAKGWYYKVGFGMGGNVQIHLDLAIYKAETDPISVRFNDGAGRDIWMSLRNSLPSVGVRFGGTKEVPVWGQFNMLFGIQHINMHLAYVYQDGTVSLGHDKTMNGIYSSFSLSPGLGFAAGIKLFGPLAVTLGAEYMFATTKQHPEYYQYSDNNDIGKDMNTYIPRDIATYINDPFSGTSNSISNDFKGFKFNFGVQLMINTID